MRRREFLAGVAAGTTAGTAGCVGGGEVVVSLQKELSIQPETGWVKKIPDISEKGGAVKYTVRASRPFDVYFFVGSDQYRFYEAYVDGREPRKTPAGHEKLSASASEKAKDEFVAQTKDNGAREALTAKGPYFFVVDYTAYRGETPPKEFEGPLTPFVDLTVSKDRLF